MVTVRHWVRRSTKTLLRDRWLHVSADRVELPSGLVLDPFYVLHEPEWVHVVAMDDAGRILVVRQYRYAANAVCTELPGGVANAGESMREAAGRELLEETGYTAREWLEVGWMYANPARQTNRVHVFLATGLTQAGGQSLDPSEEIEVGFMTVTEVEAAIAAGEFSQALHIASFYRSRAVSR